MDKWDPNWNKTSYASRDNYWAGAKKACDDIGMSLPDKSKLLSLYQASQKDSSLGLPTSGLFWASSEDGAPRAYYVDFNVGLPANGPKFGSSLRVLCVGD